MKTYIARQPIFNKNMLVYGYELLYREGETNAYNPDMDGELATKSLVSNAVTTFGLKNISDGKVSFINFTENLLTGGLPYLMSPKEIVIEILEDVKPTEQVMESLRSLKELGYTLAMDDYTNNRMLDSIVELADIVKVDFIAVDPRLRMELPRRPKFRGKQMLAEKLETEIEFQKAKRDGYQLFQGYYFSEPVIFSKERMDISGSTYMRAFRELRKPGFSYDRLERIIRLDVNLTYKLLYRVNTLNYYRGRRIHAVRQALIRMGIAELQRWLLLILLEDCATVRCSEFIKTALIRGVFCEWLATEMDLSAEISENAFITGMFSMIDAQREEEDLSAVLDSVGLTESIKNALLGDKNIYSEILDFVMDYEKGEMERLDDFIERNQLDSEAVANIYMKAVEYADFAFNDSITNIDLRFPYKRGRKIGDSNEKI